MKNPSLLHYIPEAVRSEIPEWIRLFLARIRPGKLTRAPKVGQLPARVVRRRVQAEFAALQDRPLGEAIRIITDRHGLSRSAVYALIRRSDDVGRR